MTARNQLIASARQLPVTARRGAHGGSPGWDDGSRTSGRHRLPRYAARVVLAANGPPCPHAEQGESSLLRKPLVGWVLIALCFGQGSADVASAASDGEEEVERDYVQSDLWVPTASVSVVVHQEKFDLFAENPIAFSFDTTESKTLASLRFGGELMSPTFEDLPLAPRFYLSAGVLWSTPGNSISHQVDETRTVDDYRRINLPRLVRSFDAQQAANPASVTAVTTSDFEGQGNRISSRQRHNAWYVGLGSAIAFPRGGYTIRLRPSIEYVGEEFDHAGEFTILTDLDPAIPRFIINEVDLKSRQTQHSLGPGLEFELVNHLDGNVTLAFFTQTRFLWVVNDPGVTLRGKTNDGGDVTYKSDRRRFSFRGGAGFRIGFRNLAFDF